MSMQRPRAAIAGCVSVDICPRFISAGAKDFGELIRPGQVTRIEGNDLFPGGPVANTGLALSIFGVEPCFCAKIGKDAFGQMVRSMLEESLVTGTPEVALVGIVEDDALPTAYSLILAPEGLDRAILQNPGANNAYGFADLDPALLQDCQLFHFGHPSSLRAIYDHGGEDLFRLFTLARESGCVTSLDLCSIDPASDAGQADWPRILARVLPLVDFFVPSLEELRQALALPDVTSAEALAEASQSLGAGSVLIKAGEQGMFARMGSQDSLSAVEAKLGFSAGTLDSWVQREGWHPAVLAPQVVSGLGAGDTSIAAFLAGLLRGESFDRSIRYALTEGALCVGHPSATGGLKPLESLGF